jgi:hypothetical protein
MGVREFCDEKEVYKDVYSNACTRSQEIEGGTLAEVRLLWGRQAPSIARTLDTDL